MTPKEVYIICTKIVKRKKELENENKPIEKIIEILKQEFSDLFEKKPFIFKNIANGNINIQQFKEFAESAESVMQQMRSNTSGPPKEPVSF